MIVENEKPISDYPDRISETFHGQTLLITGVTGFVGKVLLEKLLRACLGIDKIYVLLRRKYNLTPSERLRQIFKSPLFDVLKQQQGVQILNKVIPIEGDIGALNLGLSASSRHQLIAEVTIIYHCAALLRFDESLKNSVLMNVRGTKCMLDLSKEMQKLQLFSHISSAYCHPYERVIYEKPYNPPADPLKIIKTCEEIDESILSALTHKILDGYPNTYCFTKALSEELINKELGKMPIILLRPSLVIPAWKEPIPGWTDTINGSLGFQIAAGKGILRTIYIDVTCYPDLIPVDIAVNAFLCAAFDYLRHRNGKPPRNIYNLTSSDKHKVSWHEIINLGREVIQGPVPLNWVVWYPGGCAKNTRIAHNLSFFLQHIMPAVIIDTFLQIFNKKPILLPIHRRIQKGFDILKFYNGKQWDFNNKDALTARDELNPFEKVKYNVGEGFGEYFEYFKDSVLCARRYILKENDESIPRAKQHMKMMYYVDKIAVCTMILLIFSWIY